MQKKIMAIVFPLFIALSLAGCAASARINKKELGKLQTAVETSAFVVQGEYGDTVPADFSAAKFFNLVNGKIPSDYYKVLQEYLIEVKPLRDYYLLIVYSQSDTRSIILFDYSCTPQADGLVYLNPTKFDIHHLENYNQCK